MITIIIFKKNIFYPPGEIVLFGSANMLKFTMFSILVYYVCIQIFDN